VQKAFKGSLGVGVNFAHVDRNLSTDSRDRHG
jgi:hypothetical protein